MKDIIDILVLNMSSSVSKVNLKILILEAININFFNNILDRLFQKNSH